MKNYVWYASYGSNLLMKRFMKYIQGGEVPGASYSQIGCTDKTPPLKDSKILINHQLYFSQRIIGWDNMGVAFIKPDKDYKTGTLGRMYLISKQQFEQIVWQENNIQKYQNQPDIDLELAIEKGSMVIGNSLYNKLLCLGRKDTYPIFTFTTNLIASDIKYNRPGANYIKVITKGIKETYKLTNNQIVEYFSEVPGIKDCISNQELQNILISV